MGEQTRSKLEKSATCFLLKILSRKLLTQREVRKSLSERDTNTHLFLRKRNSALRLLTKTSKRNSTLPGQDNHAGLCGYSFKQHCAVGYSEVWNCKCPLYYCHYIVDTTDFDLISPHMTFGFSVEAYIAREETENTSIVRSAPGCN